VDTESTVVATLSTLALRGAVASQIVQKAMRDLDVDPEKAFPQVL
jgi:pyruvate dehydrogenase complex dehydrogenase (E1) component